MVDKAFPVNPSKAHSKTTATVAMSTAADGLSDVLDLGGLTLSSYCLSTSFSSTSISFRGSHISTDIMRDIHTVSATGVAAELVHQVGLGTLVTFDTRRDLGGIRYLQFRSGISSAPAALTAEEDICLGLHNGD